jgi:cyclophilin family peptidyl-prolyl cis-trans isomerase
MSPDMRSTSKLLLLALLVAMPVYAAKTTTKKSSTKSKTTSKTTAKPLTIERMQKMTVDLETTAGTITLELFPDKAVNHVRNFIELARSGFYDGTNFHRVIPGFMIQGGDPNTRSGPRDTWGSGGSPKTLNAEFNDVHHARGILSMARTNDPNSASSQFFICVADAGYLDGQYTVFGKVQSGMDVVDKIVNGKTYPGDQPVEPVIIKKARVKESKESK